MSILRRVRISFTCSAGISTPRTRASRSSLKVTSGRAGTCSSLIASCTGPDAPPAIASNNSVARSMARTCCSGSTPRSNRNDASLCNPKRRARPAIAEGAKKADSRKMSLVCSDTAVDSPPMIPASPTGPLASAITSVSSVSSISCPPSSSSTSPGSAYRATILSLKRSRSYACIGWPSSSIT